MAGEWVVMEVKVETPATPLGVLAEMVAMVVTDAQSLLPFPPRSPGAQAGRREPAATLLFRPAIRGKPSAEPQVRMDRRIQEVPLRMATGVRR